MWGFKDETAKFRQSDSLPRLGGDLLNTWNECRKSTLTGGDVVLLTAENTVYLLNFNADSRALVLTTGHIWEKITMKKNQKHFV